MKTVTFLLEDRHAAWVRGKKEKFGVSLSQVIRDILDEEMLAEGMLGEMEWLKSHCAMKRAEENRALTAPEEK